MPLLGSIFDDLSTGTIILYALGILPLGLLVLCIFRPTGFLLPFHRGFEQILKHCPAPIIPVCLEQVWGSIFSYRGGKLIWKWPVDLPFRATADFGEPLPPTAHAAEVRQAVQKLSAD